MQTYFVRRRGEGSGSINILFEQNQSVAYLEDIENLD